MGLPAQGHQTATSRCLTVIARSLSLILLLMVRKLQAASLGSGLAYS